MSGVVMLSRLEAGWTGTVTVTGASGLIRVISPDARTSAAKVWSDIATEVIAVTSSAVKAWASTDLKLNIEASTFTLVATGTTQTRLALTGTYTGVESITTASALSNLVQGDEVGSALPAGGYDTGAPAGDGVLGVRPRATAPSGSVRLYEPVYLANILVLEAALDDGGTYDVFIDGRVIHRFRAGTVTRRRWGRRAALAMLELGGNVVSL